MLNIVLGLTELQLEGNESQERTMIFIKSQAINPQLKTASLCKADIFHLHLFSIKI